MEKLKVNYVKAYFGLVMTSLIIFAVFYLAIGSKEWPPTPQDYILLALILALTIICLFAIRKSFSIEYDRNSVNITRFGKIEVYNFDNIIYYDEEYSIKHKAITFYTNKGVLKFIALDKEKKLYKVFKENCRNAISKEEFIARFPSARL
jgi:hypothetical protein